MRRMWLWCEDRAAGGWALAFVVTVVLFVALGIYVAGASQAVLQRCGI